MESNQVGFLLTVVMLVLVFHYGNCNFQQFRFLKSIRTNIVKDLEDAESVLHRDSRSVHRRRRSVLNSTEQPEALDEHNRLRRLEGSSNMELLIWDNDLANAAERTAQNCTWAHSNTGQNLFTTTSGKPINLTAAIEAWYDEKQYYNNYYITGTCQPQDQQCLHYSQIVWGHSRKLGCAYTRCPTLAILNWNNALFLVCNYNPPGNINKVKPYKDGVPCSQCASGSWYCNNGLCDGSCTATGPSCDCAIMCQNYATVNSATCSCSCAPGWYGSDCSEVCENKNPLCDPQPGQSGYPPSFCTRDDYGPTVREECPKMCGQCIAVGGNSSSALLRNMMLVWLSWLLPYSLLRSI